MSQTSLWSLEATFSPEVRQISRAREFVTQTLVEHRLGDLVEDVRLVVSELATNASRHAQTPYTVSLGEVGPVLLLTVHDGSSTVPTAHAAHPRPKAVAGRGLHIVDLICDAWGVAVMPDETKSVWATFPTPSGQGPGRSPHDRARS